MEAYRLKTFVFIFLSLLLTAKASATVLFVIPEYSPSSIALVNKTKQNLLEDIDLKTITDVNRENIKQYRAVVLVGAQVLNQWAISGVPTVAVLVSSKQAQRQQRLINTSIYTDPPLTRQILLAIELLGEQQSFGILFKNSRQAAQYDLDDLGQRFWPETKILSYYSEANDSIPRALYPLLRDNKALIGIYDNDLYSSVNIKTRNGVVHILNPGHEFGFGEFTQRMNSANGGGMVKPQRMDANKIIRTGAKL